LVKDKLAELQTQYQGIVVQLQELQKLSQILAEIEKLKAQLKDLDAKYLVVINSLGQNQQALVALKSQVSLLQNQMAQNLIKISELTTLLAQQGVDIGKILAEIAELKKSTEEIKKSLEELLSGGPDLYTNSYQWKRLQSMDFIGVSTYSFDKERRRIYFLDVKNKYLKYYSLDENTFGSITVTGFPNFDNEGASIFNPAKNTIQFWRAGKDRAYEVSRDGGAIIQIANGAFDPNLYGSNPIYNGSSKNPAQMNGYGLFSVKNSAFEVNGTSWVEKRQNNSSQPYKRAGAFIYPNQDFTKAYLISGYGNISGSQQESSCSIPNVFPWANDLGKECWLSDIWEVDLKTWEVKNILPLGSNFEETGYYGYDYSRGIFYSFGGFLPPKVFNQPLTTTNKLRKFDPKVDTGWVTITQNGTLPNLSSGTNPVLPLGSTSFFDDKLKRFIVVIGNQIWELKL
jgi:hypothetical protein